MSRRQYIINRRAALKRSHYFDSNSITIKLDGVDQVKSALGGVMDKETLRWAKKMLRKEAKPLIISMRANINKSKKKATSTVHRHFTKKKFTTIERQHKPGQLRRSIGVLASKKFKDIPVVYVGNRRGVMQKNDGWYGHFLEFGTVKQKAQEWHKRAVMKVGKRVRESVMDNLFRKIGVKVEAGK